MSLNKRIGAAFDEVRKVFFPTPAERAEQERRNDISMNEAHLKYAAQGLKVERYDYSGAYGAGMAGGLGMMGHVPVFVELSKVEQAREIEKYTTALQGLGVSEQSIQAVINDAQKDQAKRHPNSYDFM